MPSNTTRKTVVQLLEDCAKTHTEKNELYGNCYKIQGELMEMLFPLVVQMNCKSDWNRMGIVYKIVDKLIRYSANFHKGGHEDSLHDISVYCQMLQELDNEQREKQQ
jgi:hypothetical protein